MQIATLKKLIEAEFDRVSTISEFKREVFRLIDLYESENGIYYQTTTIPTLNNEPDEVQYSSVCFCNPINGGSGVCGCYMGGRMVKNPKKYGFFNPPSSSTPNVKY